MLESEVFYANHDLVISKNCFFRFSCMVQMVTEKDELMGEVEQPWYIHNYKMFADLVESRICSRLICTYKKCMQNTVIQKVEIRLCKVPAKEHILMNISYRRGIQKMSNILIPFFHSDFRYCRKAVMFFLNPSTSYGNQYDSSIAIKSLYQFSGSKRRAVGKGLLQMSVRTYSSLSVLLNIICKVVPRKKMVSK